MVSFAPPLLKGGGGMSDYELLMVVLTILSLVVMLITKDKQ